MPDPAQKFNDKNVPGNTESAPPGGAQLRGLENGERSGPTHVGKLAAAEPSQGTPNEDTTGSKTGLKALEGGGDSSAPNRSWYTGDGASNTGKNKQKSGGFRAKITKRRSVLAGAVIGAITAVVVAVLTILSGPFQFIHIAQLLTQFHFSTQQDQSDDRLVKVARYIRYKNIGAVEKTRLGVAGNRVANYYETKLNTNGVKTEYGPLFGTLDGYTIDPAKYNEGSMSKDELKQYFKDSYNLDLSETGDGKLFVKSNDLGGLFTSKLKTQGFIRSMLSETGMSKISGTTGARVLGKRASLSWHPISNLDTKVLKAIDDWWVGRNAEIEKGVTAEIALDTQQPDPNQTPEQQAQAAADAQAKADAAKAAAAEGQTAAGANTSGDSGPLKAFSEHIATSIGLGATAAVGILCLADGIGQAGDQLQQAQVVEPLIRLGMESIVVGNQAMSNNVSQDISSEQLGKYSDLLNAPADYSDKSTAGTSWSEARSIQAEEGKPLTGPDVPSDAKISQNGNFLTQLFSGTVGTLLKPVCSAAGSLVGQIITTTIGFLTGPVTTAITTALFVTVGPSLYNYLAQWLAGQPINPLAAGADYGNYINYGARYAANDQLIASGGRELTPTESASLQNTENIASQNNFNAHGIAYKIFNPTDRNTVAAHLLDNVSPSFTQNIAKMGAAFLNIGHSLASLPRLFMGVAHAAPATPYDYGFPGYGFSADEMNSSLVNNPYQNADAVVNTILPNNQDFITRAKACFGVNIGPAPTYNVDAISDGVPSYHDINTSGNNCTDTSPSWQQFRFYILDTQVAESADCYSGNPTDAETIQSCTDIGFSNSNASGATN